ncbi:MAG: FAD:protein FMN transferase [Tissierellaceae bacterium]|jgi:thiamine biosynthesis lipoprotein|nr:FAD:protein FMN transferase [Tissierellaceae bacterium]
MNKKYLLELSIIILSFSLIFTGCHKEENKSIEKTEFMMDTVMTIKIYDKKDEKTLDNAFKRIAEIENRMSNTIKTSDITKVNNNAGIVPVKVHNDVYYVLKKAKYYAELSNGAYEPTIGPLVDLWNINGEGKIERSSIPDKKDIEIAREKVDYKKLELLDNNQVFLKDKGMKLDLGGIVKGYAADEVKKILEDNGVKRAIIDLGGNIYAVGNKGKNTKWKIGLQNPFGKTGSYVGIIQVEDSSVVTSGDYERYFIVDGVKYHHIIDAKTGYPVNNELTSVSIISNKSIDCDALSTTIFVLGTEKGKKFLNNFKEVECIFIKKDKEIILPKKLSKLFSVENKDFKLIKEEY